ncbi:hypothetical protein [Nitratireductor alexandrii]|uniref:hypothetical protein n=1 Tax=Nitratireductor alexandrii TaxID=2448161 RepID=UPI000FD7A9CC|nr:hypothetical protein [Nitratireductor alexandrii]
MRQDRADRASQAALSALRLSALGLALAAAACQAGPAGPGSLSTPGKSAALRTMEHIAAAVQACWFASRDPAFKPYRMADELNSFSGRPRILLVPARNPEARPLLVVQAEGDPAKVDAFGPLMDDKLGNRAAADLRRWTAGSQACA